MCPSPPVAISQVINYSSAGILLIFIQPAVLSQEVSTQTERSRIFHDRQVIFKITALTAYSPFHNDDTTSQINQEILYNSPKKSVCVESLFAGLCPTTPTKSQSVCECVVSCYKPESHTNSALFGLPDRGSISSPLIGGPHMCSYVISRVCTSLRAQL